MADLEFNEQQYTYEVAPTVRRSWLAKSVIATGLATDDAGAQRVLWVVLFLVIAAIVYLWVAIIL